jgi:hypothetical protein
MGKAWLRAGAAIGVGWGLAVFAMAACTGGGSASVFTAIPSSAGLDASDAPIAVRAGSQPCDPLQAAVDPVALGDLVGAGRAKDGTVYVLDHGPDGAAVKTLRAFVSDGTVMRRRQILGSGESPSFVDATLAPDLQIGVDLANASATRMGIFHGDLDPKTKSFDIGTQGEQLTMLAASDLAPFTWANLTSVDVMYDATTSDGHRFIAFAPQVDYSDDKVRVFYGTPDRMIQRTLLSMSVDSTIHMEIDLDGKQTIVQISFCGSGLQYFGPTRLEDVATQARTPLIPTSRFECSDASSPTVDAGPDAGEGGAPSTPAPPPDVAAEIAGLTFLCY